MSINAPRSYLCLGATGFFGLFLIASPPHRVHHFFDQRTQAEAKPPHRHLHEDHAGSDRSHENDNHSHSDRSPQPQRDSGAQPNCALQMAAQHGNLSLSPLVTIQVSAQISSNCYLPALARQIGFSRSQYSPRAPPTAS